MSRLNDLIDLLQTTNEIYLINPNRNIRSVYIQIDDLCELTMKTWLQDNVQDWSPISHQHNNTDHYKGFRKITKEIRSSHPNNHILPEILSQIESRRDNRNNFFHNHNQAGLTVNEENCLQAFSDLYQLNIELFGHDFKQRIQANPVVLAQIALIKLKLRSSQTSIVLTHYQEVLGRRGPLELHRHSLGYEFLSLYEDSTRFLRRIQEYFEEQIMVREDEVNRIRSLRSTTKKHRIKLGHLKDEIDLLREIIDECLTP